MTRTCPHCHGTGQLEITDAMRKASRKNGSAPPKEGSRPRGRPKKETKPG